MGQLSWEHLFQAVSQGLGPFHYEETPSPRISTYLILSPKDSKGENLKDYTEGFMARLDGSQSSFYPHFIGQNSVLWSHLNTRGGAGRRVQQCAQDGEGNEIGNTSNLYRNTEINPEKEPKREPEDRQGPALGVTQYMRMLATNQTVHRSSEWRLCVWFGCCRRRGKGLGKYLLTQTRLLPSWCLQNS